MGPGDYLKRLFHFGGGIIGPLFTVGRATFIPNCADTRGSHVFVGDDRADVYLWGVH